MKIKFKNVGTFIYAAFMVDTKNFDVPVGLWEDHIVDDMLESMGFRETCSSIEDGPNTDFVVDFYKREIEFL